MIEALLLVCCLAIVTPMLMIAIAAYNAQQMLQGKPPVSSAQAVRDMIRSISESLESWVKNLFGRSDNASSKKASKLQEQVEDAEFREVE